MASIPTFEQLTADQIEQTLIAAELEVARLRHVQVELIRSADRRQVPLGDGSRTLVEWISSRLDVTPETARALDAVASTGLGDSRWGDDLRNCRV